jgi:hypothetical protein
MDRHRHRHSMSNDDCSVDSTCSKATDKADNLHAGESGEADASAEIFDTTDLRHVRLSKFAVFIAIAIATGAFGFFIYNLDKKGHEDSLKSLVSAERRSWS